MHVAVVPNPFLLRFGLRANVAMGGAGTARWRGGAGGRRWPWGEFGNKKGTAERWLIEEKHSANRKMAPMAMGPQREKKIANEPHACRCNANEVKRRGISAECGREKVVADWDAEGAK